MSTEPSTLTQNQEGEGLLLTSHVRFAMRPSQCPSCACLPRPGRGGKSHVFSSLPPLCRSLRSFSHSLPLFSTACSLFYENTRGWGGFRLRVRTGPYRSGDFSRHSPLITCHFPPSPL